MKKSILIVVIISVLILCISSAGLLLWFLKNRKGDDDHDKVYSDIVEIEYRFTDASVPPEYHRSYTIEVTPDSISIKVDSYGDILVEEEYDINEKEFQEIVDSLAKNKIDKKKLSSDNDGCTGGTSESISYIKEDGGTFEASVYHCAGIDAGDLSGNTGSFSNALKKLIPDFEELIK
ncbi:hypothetical protein JW766_02005 [Candidatus Dojkabacteria bacterium]|nr:hypothetical protein [Candidatus Dojkabacteria bacterium]